MSIRAALFTASAAGTEKVDQSGTTVGEGPNPPKVFLFTDAVAPGVSQIEIEDARILVEEAVLQYLEGMADGQLSKDVIQEAFDYADQRLSHQNSSENPVRVSTLLLGVFPGEDAIPQSLMIAGAGDLCAFARRGLETHRLFSDPNSQNVASGMGAESRYTALSNALGLGLGVTTHCLEIDTLPFDDLLIATYGLYETLTTEEIGELGTLARSETSPPTLPSSETSPTHTIALASLPLTPSVSSAPASEIPLPAQESRDPLAEARTGASRSFALTLSVAAACALAILGARFVINSSSQSTEKMAIEEPFMPATAQHTIPAYEEPLSAEESVATLQEQNRRQSETIETLLEELANLSSESNESSSDHFEKMEVIRDLERTKRELGDQLSIKSDKIEHLEQTIATLEDVIEKSQLQGSQGNEWLQTEIKRLEANYRSREQAISQELNALREQLSESHEKLMTMSAENTSLSNELAAERDLAAEKTVSLESEIATLRQNGMVTENHYQDELRKTYARIESLQAENRQAQEQLAELEAVRATLRTEGKSFEAAAEGVMTLASEGHKKSATIGRQNEVIDTQRQEIDVLSSKLNHIMDEHQGYRKETISQIQRLEAHAIRAEDLERQVNTLQYTLSTKEKEAARLIGDLQDLKASHQFLLEEKGALAKKVFALENFETKYSEEMRARLTAEESVRSLEAQIEAKDQLVATLKKVNSQLQESRLSDTATARIPSPPAPSTLMSALEPSKAPAQTFVPGRTHVVQRGDTLRGISQQYYGTATRWYDIYEANSEKIKDKNTIVVGSRLQIP